MCFIFASFGALNSRHYYIFSSKNESGFKSAVEITRDLGLNCSPLTTRRRLRASDIRCYAPAVKEVLTPTIREHRLGLARQYSVEEAEFWRNVIFTEEFDFNSLKSNLINFQQYSDDGNILMN